MADDRFSSLPVPHQPHQGPLAVGRAGAGRAAAADQGQAPPKQAPNVLLILPDDVGFGAAIAFGGPVNTPCADRLAAGSLKYPRFHATSLCAPTRAALLSGRNHHSVGMGHITEAATASAPGGVAAGIAQSGVVGRLVGAQGRYSATGWLGTGVVGVQHRGPCGWACRRAAGVAHGGLGARLRSRRSDGPQVSASSAPGRLTLATDPGIPCRAGFGCELTAFDEGRRQVLGDGDGVRRDNWSRPQLGQRSAEVSIRTIRRCQGRPNTAKHAIPHPRPQSPRTP